MRGEPLYDQPKYPTGAKPVQVERAKKSLTKVSEEDEAKRDAKLRDGHKCRWPHAHGERGICRRLRKESAHVKAKGAGGSDETDNLITFCVDVHQGPKSLHSGHRRPVPLTRDGMDGICAFEERKTVPGKWIEIGREISIGVLARRSA